jgi:hypothetical protein
MKQMLRCFFFFFGFSLIAASAPLFAQSGGIDPAVQNELLRSLRSNDLDGARNILRSSGMFEQAKRYLESSGKLDEVRTMIQTRNFSGLEQLAGNLKGDGYSGRSHDSVRQRALSGYRLSGGSSLAGADDADEGISFIYLIPLPILFGVPLTLILGFFLLPHRWVRRATHLVLRMHRRGHLRR